MKDFSFWEKAEDIAEGSGRSEKIWLTNPDTGQTGLFKFKKDKTTTDHFSECIASDIASLIGLPCAKIEVGTYNNREGSMSYNIKKPGQTLIEGVYCISSVYKNYDVKELKDHDTNAHYSLEMIQTALEPFKLFDKFLPILIFDFLIGNSDRHQNNWALIEENRTYQICSLYDNSSSLCAYINEEKIDLYLGNDINMWRSLVDTKSKSILYIKCKDKKRPTHLEVVTYLQRYHYNQTFEFVKSISISITDISVSKILNKYTEGLSEKKERFNSKIPYIQSCVIE